MVWDTIVNEKTDTNQSKNLDEDWTTYKTQNWLIYGYSKSGKTFVAVQRIKDRLDKDENAQAYIVNTDMGFVDPAIEIGLDQHKQRVHYHYVRDIKEAAQVMNEINEKATPHDIVLFDLVSWIWDEAQKEFIQDLSGGNVAGFIQRALKDPKKFGLFDGMTWGYVKKFDDTVSSKLTRNTVCEVIGIAGHKDVTLSYKINKKKEDLWYEIGMPAGRKDIMYEFSNIIRIDKEESGVRRYMIVGSRKGDTDYQWRSYTSAKDFWEKVEDQLGVINDKN